jgi:aryl-alcohol dehydrogenase-like predicted oxidoreductase
MEYRALGRTGIRVSAIALGAGPVSGLMTGGDADAQIAVVARAVELGVNWFDTAAGYGAGRSEENLGPALRAAGAAERVHVATKVRLTPEHFGDFRAAVLASVHESLRRLGLERVTLLQLHNPLSARRGEEPTSITPDDVLGPGGVLEAAHQLQRAGLVDHFGLTGTGQVAALRQVIAAGAAACIQIPYHVLNPSAGQIMPEGFSETNHGNLIADCAARQTGILAIRVLAGGALALRPPSQHTLTTPYFPLALYERDRQRAEVLAKRVALPLPELAVRFALSHPQVHSAIVGFATPEEVEAAVRWADAGPLPVDLLRELCS